MNVLTSIRIRGLKGAGDVSYTLPAAVLFLGPNGSGKSRVLDAVRLLVRGQHPDAGRGGKPAREIDDILTLATGDELEVSGTWRTPDGTWRTTRRWVRVWTQGGTREREPKGSVVVEVVGPDGRQLLKKEAEGALARLVGPAAGVDLSALLGPSVTDSQRMALLFEAAASTSTWTPEAVKAQLERRQITGLSKAYQCWRGQPVDPPLVDWLTRAWQEASARSDSTHRAYLAAQAALRELDSSEPVDPAEVGRARQLVAQLEQDLVAVTGRSSGAEDRAREQVGRAEQQLAAQQQARLDLQVVQAEITTLVAKTGGRPEVERIRALLADLDDELADGSVPDLEARRALTLTALQTATDAVRAAEAEQLRCLEAAAAARQRETQARHVLAEAKAGRAGELATRCVALQEQVTRVERAAEPALHALALVRQLIAQADEDLEDASCPTCGQTIQRTVLARLEAAAAGQERQVASARQLLAVQRAEVEQDLDGRIAVAGSDLLRATQAADAVSLTVAAAREAIERAQRGVSEARQVESAATRALLAARDQRAKLREDLARAEASGADAALATAQARERELRLVLERPTPDLPLLQAALEQARAQGRRERDQATSALQQAKEQAQPLEHRLAIHLRTLEVRAKAGDAEKTWREAKRVEEQLGPGGLMGEIVAELLKPLTELVNAGLDASDGTFAVRTLDERGNPCCRPGLRRGQHFHAMETLSGGERTRLLPVLQPALATLIGSPWPAILGDALEQIDGTRRAAFLRQVVELQQRGKVAQVILAGCLDVAPVVDGLAVVQVGPEPAREAA